MALTYSSLTEIANNHDFNITYTNEFDKNQTAGTILTPTSGKSLQIVGYMINTEGTTGYLRLYTGTSNDSIGTTYAATNPASGYVPVYKLLARNEVLKVTSTLGDDNNYFLLINYRER